MSDRSNIISSITETIADYRKGDLPTPNQEHVERWVTQFDNNVQLPILQEMDHVLKKTYFSRSRTREFMAGLIQSENLVGSDPCAFWAGVKFLDIQDDGASQTEMISLFSEVLENECGFTVADCGGDSQTYVYLDDAIFSGGRISRELQAWIATDAPDEANLHVVVIATHKGAYYHRNKVNEALKASSKNINIQWWFFIELENRKKYKDSSDVLWPVSISADNAVQAYVATMNYRPDLRNPGQVGGKKFFSSDENRQILEQELLKAGVRIRDMCPNLNTYQRPLGNVLLQTLGFGSLIVTFRNCPNNTPLALWVGAPWNPLFPRAINSETLFNRSMENLDKDFF